MASMCTGLYLNDEGEYRWGIVLGNPDFEEPILVCPIPYKTPEETRIAANEVLDLLRKDFAEEKLR